LGEGLLTSEGEYHKHHSRIIQPAFHRKMIESYVPVMVHCAAQLMNTWQDGMQVEIMEAMMTMSAAIAAKTMFNADLEQEATEIVRALHQATSLFGRVSVPFSEWLLQLPFPSSIRFKRAKAVLDKAVLKMINERRRNKADNGDLASLLLHAHEEGSAGTEMTDQEVRDEALTLFLTAFDTTGTALTWTWYLLSKHTAVESQMHEELSRVLQGRIPTAEDIPHLQFTRMVFAESLRIYPPSYIIPRQALQDFQIDQYIIPRGTLILMSPYLIHHDSRFHPDPEQFNPHNWENQVKNQNPKYAYFPFSGGPRSCIGEPFAWMEGVLVLATIAQSWRMQSMPDHKIKLLQLINLRPKGGMLMTVHQRK
jgi:cytochrome P450